LRLEELPLRERDEEPELRDDEPLPLLLLRELLLREPPLRDDDEPLFEEPPLRELLREDEPELRDDDEPLLFADPLRDRDDEPLLFDDDEPLRERDDRDEAEPRDDELREDDRERDREVEADLRSSFGISRFTTSLVSRGICFATKSYMRCSSRRIAFATLRVSVSPTCSASSMIAV